MTEEEQEIMDWILLTEGLPSASQVIRTALLRTALHLGMNPGDAAQSLDSRLAHPPRRFHRNKPVSLPALPEKAGGPAARKSKKRRERRAAAASAT